MRGYGSVTGGWIDGSLNSKSRATEHRYTVTALRLTATLP
jgi:hypothetical protein